MNTLTRVLIVTLGLVLLWQSIVTLFSLPSYILPSPILVFQALWHNLSLILHETSITLYETILGLLLGVLFGATAALLVATIQPIRHWLLPLLIIFQALPTFAIAPLLVIWFGYGVTSKIVTTMLIIFFPVTSSFFDGLRATPNSYLDLSKIMHASRLTTLRHIRIPAALPKLASGLRVATAAAPMGAVVGEWVGASKGLGFLMLNANARMQIPLMFACLITLLAMALILYFTVSTLLHRWIFWESH